MATAAIVRPHNPLTPSDFTWTHASWMSDPKWAKPADGAAIASVRNSSGGGDPAAAGGAQPTMRYAGINGHASAEFNGTANVLRFNIADVAQPFKMLVVFKPSSVAAAKTILARGGGGGAHGLGFNATPAWISRWLAANALIAGTADTNVHSLRSRVNGSSSTLLLDGTSIATGNAGTGALAEFMIGAGFDGASLSQFFAGQFAFAGIAPDGTADASIDREEAMLRRLYNY